MTHLAKAAVLLAGCALAGLAFLAPAHARGGGAPWLSSPGYQRRLAESRATQKAAQAPKPIVRARAHRTSRRRD